MNNTYRKWGKILFTSLENMTVTAFNFHEADDSIMLRSSALNVTPIGHEM